MNNDIFKLGDSYMTEKYNSRIEKREQAKTKKKTSADAGGRKPKRSMWKKVLFACLTLGCVLIIGAVGGFLWIIKDAPDLNETLLKTAESSELLASDGETVIAEVGTEKRYNVTLDQIPDTLIDAVIATEDANFYDHFGIDVKRTIKAVFSTVFDSGNTQGGSTITQQVVKNAFLTSEQTITRKVQEWYLAVQLERKFSKDEILEMYFNKNLYGGDIYGVAKAAERYFGLEPDELEQLTLEQVALLAGVPQSPNNFNVVVEDNLERAEKRRNTVLQLMNRHDYLTDGEMEEAQNVAIEDTLNIQSSPNGQYQAFVDVAISEVQEKTDANIFEDGLTIITTLDPEIQQITEDVISSDDYIDFPDNENLETGVMILDTDTGAIQAIGGGRNYQAGGYNYATMISRQPGSTAKPLLSYGPAINSLKWSTAHLLVDEEWSYSSGKIVGNSSGRYTGEQTMRYQLTYSANVPALKTYQEVGAKYATDFAKSLGLPIADEDTTNESNPLGTMSTASPLIMAGAYATFGNGGYYTEPHTISKIISSDGIEEDMIPESEQVMEDYTAYMVTDMLRDVVSTGTGTRASISGIDVAGKTGTTSFNDEAIQQHGLPKNASRDAWFIGYTPEYTAAVWTGYARTSSSEDYLDTEQSRLSQRIFKEIMSKVATSTERFKQPDSVVEIDGELYVDGSEDAETAKNVKVDAVTNLQVSHNENSNSIELSWSHSSDNDNDVSFEVSYTVDGNTSSLGTTSEMSAALQNPEIGKTYTFTVVAISGDKSSEGSSISITIPDATAEEENTNESENLDEGEVTDEEPTADEGEVTDEGETADENDTADEGENTPDDSDANNEGDTPVDENNSDSDTSPDTEDENDEGPEDTPSNSDPKSEDQSQNNSTNNRSARTTPNSAEKGTDENGKSNQSDDPKGETNSDTGNNDTKSNE